MHDSWTTRISKALAIASLLACTPSLTLASMKSDTVSLEVGTKLPWIASLQGTRRYVRYRVGIDGSRKPVDIWQRTGTLEVDPATKAKFLRFRQRWDGADGRLVLQESAFDPNTLAPKTHQRQKTEDRKTVVSGYSFSADAVDGLRDLPGNDHAAFHVALQKPVYNFEYDMELLASLPLAEGRTFVIPFYDAGIDPAPGSYPFKVAKTDWIRAWDGHRIECWLITADYGTGKILNRFWIDKQAHVVVREEAPLEGGGTLVKSLLPPEAGD